MIKKYGNLNRTLASAYLEYVSLFRMTLGLFGDILESVSVVHSIDTQWIHLFPTGQYRYIYNLLYLQIEERIYVSIVFTE